MVEAVTKGTNQHKYTNLFRDFLNEKAELKKYLYYDDPAEVVKQMKPPKIDRHILCDILDKQNKAFKSKPETFRAIEKLRQDDTLVIFSGQQPGLYGGPLLTLIKAIGIVKKAILLQSQIGKPVVPIFWIACDDHDFEEVNHTFLFGRNGSAEKTQYRSEDMPSVSVADICFDDETGYKNLIDQTKSILGESDFTEELYGRLFTAYSRDGNLVRAFARYLSDILPDFGMILFCPYDKDVKTISKSFFKRLAEGHFRSKELLNETEKELLDDGYHIQAQKKDTAINLFYHDPERKAIHFEDDSFRVAGKKLGLPALLDLIDKYPERFSPDVLTRPIWQSYLFPVVAQSGGPSEIAYFCQIGKLFEHYGLVQPHILFRPALTLVENHHQKQMEKYDLQLSDLAGDTEQIVNSLLSDTFPKEIETKLSGFVNNFKSGFVELSDTILESYSNMGPMTDQTYGKMDAALTHLEKKVHSQHKKNNEIIRNRIYKLSSTLYPNKSFQERVININYFISRYGFGIVDFMIEKMDIQSNEHQMIYLSDYKGKA
ncbi:MAG: bacillithiol biosynthesis cysteine-adding enzyme BshC [candidate division Zixibacteria bacterium]|nr:bacillithiol biosynthesis cysteine-adding enzyme BshC [candidate division Zixibacteria bacterium]